MPKHARDRLASERFIHSKKGAVWVDLAKISSIYTDYGGIFMRAYADADGRDWGYKLKCSILEKGKLIKHINKLIEEWAITGDKTDE